MGCRPNSIKHQEEGKGAAPAAKTRARKKGSAHHRKSSSGEKKWRHSLKDDLAGLKATALKEEAKEKFAILNPGDDDKLSTNNNEAGDFGAKNPGLEEEVKKHHAALKAMTADVAAVVAAAPKAGETPAAAAALSEANLATAAKGNDILSGWSSVHKPRPATGFELEEAFECEIKGLRSAVEEDGTLTCPIHCLWRSDYSGGSVAG